MERHGGEVGVSRLDWHVGCFFIIFSSMRLHTVGVVERCLKREATEEMKPKKEKPIQKKKIFDFTFQNRAFGLWEVTFWLNEMDLRLMFLSFFFFWISVEALLTLALQNI